MPFTLSHAVLAPPLSKLSKGQLPIAALAIGCMTPDLYRLFTTETIALTHQWSGLLFPNLPIGLFFCLLWYLLYRPVIYRVLAIQHSLNIHSFDQFVAFSLMSCVSIVIGAATHLIWDGLTHLDFRSFAFKTTLAQEVSLWGFNYPLHFILQISSSILTLPILLWMFLNYYQSHKQHIHVPIKLRLFFLLSLLVSITAGLCAVWKLRQQIPAELWNSERYFYIGRSINEFSQIGLILLSITCLLLLFFDRRSGLG